MMQIIKRIDRVKYNVPNKNNSTISNKFIRIKKSDLELINSILIAFFLSMQSIRYFFGIDTVFINIIILIVALIKNGKISFHIKTLALYTFVLGWFIVTNILFEFDKTVLTYMIFFVFYGGTAAYLSSKQYDPKKVMHYLCKIYSMMAPIVLMTAIFEGSTMGEVYSLLVGIFALIICFINKQFTVSKIPRWIHILVLTIYMYKIVLVSTRGVYLSIAIFIIIYLIVTTSKSNYKTTLKLITIIIIGIMIYQNLYVILSVLKDGLDIFGIEINALSKSIELLETQRFDHNRNWFYEYAKRGIAANWLFGQGIGAFEIQTGRVYIHNFVLQILFEGGIIYFMPFVFILFSSLKWLFPVKQHQKNMQMFIVLLICTTIPKLMFSETYIKEPKFWLLLMVILINKKYINKKSEKSNE